MENGVRTEVRVGKGRRISLFLFRGYGLRLLSVKGGVSIRGLSEAAVTEVMVHTFRTCYIWCSRVYDEVSHRVEQS